MSAADGVLSEPEPMRTVTLARTDGPQDMLAESTDNPYLVIAPSRDKNYRRWQWAGWMVVHAPTGRMVPMLHATEIEVVRRMAFLVTDMDWSADDPKAFRDPEYGRRCAQARYDAMEWFRDLDGAPGSRALVLEFLGARAENRADDVIATEHYHDGMGHAVAVLRASDLETLLGLRAPEHRPVGVQTLHPKGGVL